MLPPTVTRHHRWMETMFRRSMQSRDSARRHEACCGDARPVAARCSEPIRPAPPEDGSRSDKPAPTAEARSSLRGPLAAHPAEMLEDVATSGLLTPLDRLLALPAPRTAAGAGDREVTCTIAAPKAGATPAGRLAAAFGHRNQRALRKHERTAGRAARGGLQPALPSIAARTKRDRRRSEAHHHEPNLAPSVRGRSLALRETGGPGKPAEIACRAPSNARDLAHGESDARSKRPRGTHRLIIQTLTASLGVLRPTTLTEAGSDLHRVCLTRLCSAFRFSQPLDALLRPRPFRPCFMPVAPLSFCFQRFSLPGSEPRLSTKLSLHAVVNDRGRCLPGRLLTRPRLRGFAHPGNPYRQAGVTRFLTADPLLAFTSPRCAPTRPWPRASTKPPLMGFHTTPDGYPSVIVLTLQSFKEPRGGCICFQTHQPP
jgi:hypothetical protein